MFFEGQRDVGPPNAGRLFEAGRQGFDGKEQGPAIGWKALKSIGRVKAHRLVVDCMDDKRSRADGSRCLERALDRFFQQRAAKPPAMMAGIDG